MTTRSVQVGELEVLSRKSTNRNHLQLVVGGTGLRTLSTSRIMRPRFLDRMEMLWTEIFRGRDALIKLFGK